MSSYLSTEQHVYLRPLDPEGQDSLAKIARRIRPDSTVLDLGTGPGILGRYLAEDLGCTVDGVEYNPRAAEQARPFYRRLEVGDLEELSMTSLFAGQRYDYIICADVLEHLRDPGRVVEAIIDLLTPDGRILVSIPNVAYAGLIADLLAGEFRYGPEGIMDETHLHFFTRRSLLAFLAEHGLRVRDLDSVVTDLRDSEFSARYLDALPPALIRGLLARPDALTYQFIVEAVAGEDSGQELITEAFDNPPELGFACQLYWRHGNQDFRERDSCFVLGRMGKERQTLSFPIPRLPAAPVGLRLDLADRPGLLRIYGIELHAAGGTCLWSWDGYLDSLESATSQQVAFSNLFPGGQGVTVLLTGEDPCLVLPIAAEQLASLRQGGELRLEIAWPMSMDTLSLAQNCVPRKDMQALEKQRGAFKVRAAELEVQAGTLARQVKTLETQVQGLQATLADREATLAERTQHLSQQTEQANRLRETLAEIHASTIWRWSRPYVNTVNWLRQRLRPSPTPTRVLLTPRPIPVSTDLKVDVIVPVYRGLAETRNCLESLLRHAPKIGHEIIVIDDASPEPELTEYLRGLAASGHITLLINEENLGFVGTVNRGMALHPDRDVVLLNSDTEVAGDWLDRLVRCAYEDRLIGTVTPFSNNATICSYPRFCQDNPLPQGWSLAALDNLFRRLNGGKWMEIPTAIGFCMYIRRDCLHDIGLFDVVNFGKGYGEENDFCMRATAAGWYHVLCADTFVYHAGGVSFAETQDPRKIIATDMMRRLHPSYEELVHRYIAEDPVRPFRLSVDAARLLGRGRPVVLFVTHGIGGGTDKHIRELAELFADHLEALVLKPLADGQHELAWLREGEAFRLFFHLPDGYALLCHLLRELRLERIHFHHTKGIDGTIWDLPEDLDLPYDYTVHDYYAVCPQVSLTNLQNRYCGEPDEAGCNRCLRLAPAPGGVAIQTWRGHYAPFLEGAERVFVPSRDVAARVGRYFPQASIMTFPHPESARLSAPPTPAALSVRDDEPLRIVVLGALSPIKGPDLLEQCALDAQARNLPLEFHLLGYAYRSLVTRPKSHLQVHGPYPDLALPERLADLKPHLVWFPAQTPETYSYTLSACLQAGLPVVAPDLGAFPERLGGRPWTWIRPWQMEAKAWNDFFVAIREDHFATAIPPAVPPGLPPVPERRYEEAYLAPFELARHPVEISPELVNLLKSCAYPRGSEEHRPYKAGLKSSLLFPLVLRLRAAPWLRFAVKRIPLPWQTRFKVWLLGQG